MSYPIREITTHHVETETDVRIYAAGPVSDGGANNSYVVGLVDDGSISHCLAAINFQNGHPGKVGINGVTIEALIAICMDRLMAFQAGPYPSHYNAAAIDSLERAMESLKDRTRERVTMTEPKELEA